MLWCKRSFEQHFNEDACRLFPLQQQLFTFIDSRRACATGTQWLPFSIEFPSEREVSARLSRHTRSGNILGLFASHTSSTPATTNLKEEEPPGTAFEYEVEDTYQNHSNDSLRIHRPEARGVDRKRGRDCAVREDYSLLYGSTPLSAQERMFLAVTPAGLLDILSTIEPAQLHLYEIIREGTSCALYFDVEREGNYTCTRRQSRLEEIDVDAEEDSSSGGDVKEVTHPRKEGEKQQEGIFAVPQGMNATDDSEDSVEEEETITVFVQTRTGRRRYHATVHEYEQVTAALPELPAHMCKLNCPVLPCNTDTQDVLLRELEAFVLLDFPDLLQPSEAMKSTEGCGTRSGHFNEIFVLKSVPLVGGSGGQVIPPAKFSQHYVIKFYRHFFDNNSSCGEFVRRFVEYLHGRAAADATVHAALFFHGDPQPVTVAVPGHGPTSQPSSEVMLASELPGCSAACDGEVEKRATLAAAVTPTVLPFLPRRCVIDTAVYSRNRAMRCLGSCKLHKGSVLVLLALYRDGIRQQLPCEVPPQSLGPSFHHSVASVCKQPLGNQEGGGASASVCQNLRANASYFFATLISNRVFGTAAAAQDQRTPLHVEPPPPLSFSYSGTTAMGSYRPSSTVPHTMSGATDNSASLLSTSSQLYGGEDEASRQALEGYLAAAYQRISGPEGVVSVHSSNKHIGDRHWLYQVSGTRYCQHISREHRSNNVYIVVDRLSKTWSQKCFDPECANFRSPAIPLHVLPPPPLPSLPPTAGERN